MKIEDKQKIKEVSILLDKVMELLNDAIKLEDDELDGKYDYYNQIRDIQDELNELL